MITTAPRSGTAATISIPTVRRSLAAGVMLATVTVFGSACGGDDSSDASSAPKTATQPTGTATEATAGPAGELDVSGFDPCTAFNAEELTSLGLSAGPGEKDGDVQGVACRWEHGDTTVIVGISEAPVDDVQEAMTKRGSVSPTSYAGRDAFKVEGRGGCGFLFEAGDQTLMVAWSDPVKGNCALAEQKTRIVLAKLG